MTDAEREQLIEAYRIVLTLEPSYVVKRQAQERMFALIADRSPARIREMEVEQGIAHG